MKKDEIIFFLTYGLEWLIPASYEGHGKEAKQEIGLWE